MKDLVNINGKVMPGRAGDPLRNRAFLMVMGVREHGS